MFVFKDEHSFVYHDYVRAKASGKTDWEHGSESNVLPAEPQSEMRCGDQQARAAEFVFDVARSGSQVQPTAAGRLWERGSRWRDDRCVVHVLSGRTAPVPPARATNRSPRISSRIRNSLAWRRRF